MINLVSDKPHYENVPFEIPETWEWCRLDDIAQSNIGLTYSPSEVCNDGVPVLRSCNIKNQKLCWDELVRVKSNILDKQYLQEGDLLICARNGSRHLVGKCALINNIQEPISFGAFMAVCRSKYNQWIYYLLHTTYFDRYLDDSNSTTINQVTQKMLLDFQIPMPPILEQERIITEIQKWFELINDLESNKKDLKEYIKQVKSKVLSLAISGKLVPQDPNDEPAIELLKRINPNFKPCDTSHYENLPDGWTVCSIKAISKTISSRQYQVLQSDICKEGTFPVVSQSANYIEGYFNLKDKVLEHKQPVIVFGDHTRVVKYIDFDFIVGADGVKVLSPMIDSKYFYYLILNASENIKNRGYGRHFGLLSKEAYFIPPLKEQHRIVSLLETIEKQLDTISAEL